MREYIERDQEQQVLLKDLVNSVSLGFHHQGIKADGPAGCPHLNSHLIRRRGIAPEKQYRQMGNLHFKGVPHNLKAGIRNPLLLPAVLLV